MTPAVLPSTATILVVDDTPANLRLLTNMLKGGGYKVRPVSSGAMALRVIRTHPPDLVLLDVNMPELDGYQVCRCIKSDPRWRDIPVIFISALTDTSDKIRAFEAGGVDYVGKPFQFEEVDARVRTHLELRRKTLALEKSLARQAELERLRDTLTHMIAHDMRSPLLALQMAVELLTESLPAVPPDAPMLGATARRGAAQVVEMISQMLDIGRLETGKLELKRETADLAAIVGEAMATLGPLFGRRTIDISAPPSIKVEVDSTLIRRVVENLIGNAVKFTATTGRIGVAVGSGAEQAFVAVTDDGPGIGAADMDRIFEKYGQTQTGTSHGGSGLGLTFCRMAVEAHGGSISYERGTLHGGTFRFALPRSATADVSAPVAE